MTDDPNIPSVGQPFDFLRWWPQCLIACNCQKERGVVSLLVIHGFNNLIVCQNCNNGYHAVGLDAKGNIQLEMVIGAGTPAGKVM